MRETCLLCTSKHIAQAIVLVNEAVLGYPLHLWFAVGHLAEAETECFLEFPSLANDIREVRCSLMGQGGIFERTSLIRLLKSVREQAAIINGISDDLRVFAILSGKDVAKEEQNAII